MKVYRSSAEDVYAHLGLEEALLDAVRPGTEPILLFLVNAPAVVIGRNQNPWQEARLDRMAGAGVKLARRISGGGAVYHDAGNLNYSLILPRAAYRRDRVFDAVLAGLDACGVAASRSGTHSLVTGGLKFSGSAFCFRRDGALHHGTLLVRSDLDRLQSVLGAVMPGLETRATPSQPASVCNLADVVPHVDFARLQEALTDSLAAELASPVCDWSPDAPVLQQARTLARRNRSRAWLLDESPAWTLHLPGLSPEAGWVRLERGCVAACGPAVPGRDHLVGVCWSRSAIHASLAVAPADAQAAWRALAGDLHVAALEDLALDLLTGEPPMGEESANESGAQSG